MIRWLKSLLVKVDWKATYHHNYGRGEYFDLDLVWADRMYYQTYKKEVIRWHTNA